MKTIDDTAFAVAEYSCLRDEILKRIEIQTQIVNLALVIAGSVVSFAFGFRNGALILPIYPVIAFGLAASWEQHNLRIRQLGRYIKEELEPRTKGWENFRFDKKVKRTGTAFIARATFMFTQIGVIALTILLSDCPPPPIWFILFVIDVAAIFGTWYFIRTHPLLEKEPADTQPAVVQPGDASDSA